MTIPRDYQEESVTKTLAELARVRSTCVVAPTGVGKAVMAAMLAARWPTGKVLFATHRQKLLIQGGLQYERLASQIAPLECGPSKVEPLIYDAAKMILASIQSLHEDRIGKFKPSDFGLLIIDEFHHASPANITYRRMIDHFMNGNPNCRLCGFTATIDRSDDSLLIGPGKVAETIAYEYKLWSRTGPSATTDGWLVPLAQQFITVDGLELEKLRTVAGDWTDIELEKMFMDHKTLFQTAYGLTRAASNRPTIVFVATRRHARGETLADGSEIPGMVKAIEHYGKTAAAVLGDMDETARNNVYAAFSAGDIQYLVGCDVMSEGLDLPEVQGVAICRPTKSRLRYAQCCGRATRPAAAIVPALNAAPTAAERRRLIAQSAKPNAMIFDFVGVGNLKLAVSVADILAQSEDKEVVERAKKKAEEEPGLDVGEALTQAAEEITQERIAKAKTAWDEARRRIRATARLYTQDVNPYDHDENQLTRKAIAITDQPTKKMINYVLYLGRQARRSYSYSEVASWSFKRARSEIIKLKAILAKMGVTA